MKEFSVNDPEIGQKTTETLIQKIPRQLTANDSKLFAEFLQLLIKRDKQIICDFSETNNYWLPDQSTRRGLFEQFSSGEQALVRETMLNALETNHETLLWSLFCMGREKDSSLLDEVPIALRDTLRIVQGVCRANEAEILAGQLVATFGGDTLSEKTYNELLFHCSNLVNEMRLLQNCRVIATHSTDSVSKANMVKTGELWASEGPAHYLGEGVYAGLFGGYLSWNGMNEDGRDVSGNTYRFYVPLGACNVLIGNPVSPRAMINIHYPSIDLASISTIGEQNAQNTLSIPNAVLQGNPFFETDYNAQLTANYEELFRRLCKDLKLDVNLISRVKSKYTLQGRANLKNPQQINHVLIDIDEPTSVWTSLAYLCQLERVTVAENFVPEHFSID